MDLGTVAALAAGYTGADLSALCREAALAALEEDMGSVEVCARHFAAAAGRVRASAPAGGALEAIYRRFERRGAA